MNYRIMCACLLLAALFIPAGVLAADDGWQHGSLFSAPNWLLEQFDDESREMSNLDYFGTKLQEPTQKPPTFDDYMKEGLGYLEAGSYRDANDAFEKAISINGTSAKAWYGKGLALENQKRYLSAIDAYEKAGSYAKELEDTWGPNAGRGRCYLAIQQFENAKEAFTLAISQYEEAGISSPEELAAMYCDLAEALEMLGETNAALDALEKAE